MIFLIFLRFALERFETSNMSLIQKDNKNLDLNQGPFCANPAIDSFNRVFM
jgi:hypothetical protein